MSHNKYHIDYCLAYAFFARGFLEECYPLSPAGIGYGLDELNVQAFGSLGELTQQDLDEHKETLKNVRLWDYRPLQQTYAQLQELRPYYLFSSVDIDRYEIDGETRQVMLAGRELDKDNLTAPSWINDKLIFTHGYGVVMNPVDEVTPQGQPNFFIQDLPPQSSVSIEVTRPEIYYGEVLNDVVFVGSDQIRREKTNGDKDQ